VTKDLILTGTVEMSQKQTDEKAKELIDLNDIEGVYARYTFFLDKALTVLGTFVRDITTQNDSSPKGWDNPQFQKCLSGVLKLEDALLEELNKTIDSFLELKGNTD